MLSLYRGVIPNDQSTPEAFVRWFVTWLSLYVEEFLASRPTPKLKDCPLSIVRYCLLNTFAAARHTEGFSSIQNLRTRHVAVTETTYQGSPHTMK